MITLTEQEVEQALSQLGEIPLKYSINIFLTLNNKLAAARAPKPELVEDDDKASKPAAKAK
jgi:hypothetical protein